MGFASRSPPVPAIRWSFQAARATPTTRNPIFLVGDTAFSRDGRSGLLSLCMNENLIGKYGAGLNDNVGTRAVSVETTAS